jgi:predicted CoA-binding protein
MLLVGPEPATMPSVAVLGASRYHQKFGNKSVRAHLRAGWQVYPVNPHATEVEGLAAYPDLASVPGAVDRITVYLPPDQTRLLLDEIAAVGAQEVFFNPGSADEALLHAARERGIPAIDACSIVDLGLSPARFP